MKTTPKFRHLLASSALLASASTGFAQTTYQWSGASSSDFAISANWAPTGSGITAGPPLTTGGGPTPISTAARINVGASGNATPANALVYSSAQGHTIFNPANRALIIGNGSGTNGTVTITGGTFDSRGTTNDAIANATGSGTLNINGGHYTNVNGGVGVGTKTFTLLLNGGAGSTGGTATLNVNSGSFTTGTLTFGEGTSSLSGSAIVNLNGGVMEVGEFVQSSSSPATSTINFNGGTLRARKDSTVFMGTSASGNVVDNARVLNGAVIDTNGFAITIAKPLVQHSGSLGGLTKSGTGTLTLTAANTYVGATAVDGGTLNITGSTASGSAVTVAAGSLTGAPVATLAGTGTIGGNVSLAAESASGFKNGGVLAPTAAASGTALDVTGTTTFNTGSIFEWNLAATTSDTGATTNEGNYGQLAGTGAITKSGSGAVFKIVLGSNNFADAFWDSSKTWNNIFTGTGATTNLADIFSSFSGTGVSSTGVVAGQGQFSFTSTSTLSWAPALIPEPSSALAGLLLGVGLLRRRRA